MRRVRGHLIGTNRDAKDRQVVGCGHDHVKHGELERLMRARRVAICKRNDIAGRWGIALR